MIDWHWEVFFYYKLKRWGCELTVSQTPTFIIEPFFYAQIERLHGLCKIYVKNTTFIFIQMVEKIYKMPIYSIVENYTLIFSDIVLL